MLVYLMPSRRRCGFVENRQVLIRSVLYWCLCEASNRGMSRPGIVGLAPIGDTRPRFEASKASIIGLSRGSSFRISSHIVI